VFFKGIHPRRSGASDRGWGIPHADDGGGEYGPPLALR
jgi:hypothetical protein